MLLLGLLLLLLGWLLGIGILWILGVILLVTGLVLFLVGHFGSGVGGRRYWY